jgi:hypothetical protein
MASPSMRSSVSRPAVRSRASGNGGSRRPENAIVPPGGNCSASVATTFQHCRLRTLWQSSSTSTNGAASPIADESSALARSCLRESLSRSSTYTAGGISATAAIAVAR